MKTLHTDKHKPTTCRLRGILIPSEWDDSGSVTGIVIHTFEENQYPVESDITRIPLAAFIHQNVELIGTLKQQSDGRTKIKVDSVKIIEDHPF